MQKKPINTSTNSSNTFFYLRTVAIASVLLLLPLQTFAEKAKHYGDINDEDGKYIALGTETSTVKTSNQSKSEKKKSLKIQTKKVTESALTAEYKTGYGDENQD